MNTRSMMLVAVLLGLPLLAHASCDQVKADIDAKIQANGVSDYTLEIVSADQADSDGRAVVGTCEGDKKIVYARGAGNASPSDRSTDEGSPQPASASSTSGGG